VKIERISDNQIRCTLNKSDLKERHLKISELAYGSERAKQLFRDMMEQANIDFGFDADDIPLMIEAIPTSRDSIILVITKVENPEEFDERFSQFGISEDDFDIEDDEFSDDDESSMIESSDIVNCFEHLHELLEEAGNRADSDAEFVPLSEALQNQGKKKYSKKKTGNITDSTKAFSFSSLNPIIHVAHQTTIYCGKNSLWKDPVSQHYYLMLHRGNGKNAFRSICSTLEEYGKEETITYASQAYYNEHFQLILKDSALATLAEI
jgi:adapter protein MecA 1/2